MLRFITMHQVLVRQPLVRWLGALLLATASSSTSARADVADPVAALKSLYAMIRSGNGAAPSIDTLHAWADRNLKRKLMANNVCTIPLRKRDVVCFLKVDPATAGFGAALPEPTLTTATTNADERTVTASFSDEEMKLEIIFRFVRSGSAWELADLEARPPHKPAWRLSQVIGGN